MSSSSSTPPLPAGVGYGVVLGLGFLFALIMNGITWIQAKFSKFSPNSAAEFTAASRSVKTGLVVAGILSSCELHHRQLSCYLISHDFYDRDLESDSSPERNPVLYNGDLGWILVCGWWDAPNRYIFCGSQQSQDECQPGDHLP